MRFQRLLFCHSLNPNIIPENTAPIRSILHTLNVSNIPKAQLISMYRTTSAMNLNRIAKNCFIEFDHNQSFNIQKDLSGLPCSSLSDTSTTRSGSWLHILCNDDGDAYCFYLLACFFGQSAVCDKNIYIFKIAYLAESPATELGGICQDYALGR